MNLTISDAAVHLNVSETRLRKTLAEGDFVTRSEMRHTKTGLRKTTMLPAATVEALREHFLSLIAPDTGTSETDALGAKAAEKASTSASEQNASTCSAADLFVRESGGMYEACRDAEAGEVLPDAAADASPVRPEPVESGASVPAEKFDALLYQHNVLREELGRVTRYLEECDHLLEEMIHTIASLEERTRGLEEYRSVGRVRANPLSGALRSVSAGLQQAFQAKGRSSDRPGSRPAEVYYAGVLSRG